MFFFLFFVFFCRLILRQIFEIQLRNTYSIYIIKVRSLNKRIIHLNIFETIIWIKTKLLIFYRGICFIFLLFRRLRTHNLLKSISLYKLYTLSFINFINGYSFILKCKEEVNKLWYLICVIIFLFFCFLHYSFLILKLHHKI